jgi:predicted HAD superfamily hydrolase
MNDKPNKLVQATNILEMVLLGASDLIDYLENNTLPENKSNLMNNEYKRVKKDIKKGYKFLKGYYDR